MTTINTVEETVEEFRKLRCSNESCPIDCLGNVTWLRTTLAARDKALLDKAWEYMSKREEWHRDEMREYVFNNLTK